MNARHQDIFLQLSAGIPLHDRQLHHDSAHKKRPVHTPTPQKKLKKRKTAVAKTDPGSSSGNSLDRERGSSRTDVDLFGKHRPKRDEERNKKARHQHSNALEKASEIRKRHGIKVTAPNNCPCPIPTFAEMEKRVEGLNGIVAFSGERGFSYPTPIQMQAIPALIEKRDVVGIAPTGSGKTVAFLLPIIAQLSVKNKATGIRALFISPTHELSSQTHSTFMQIRSSLGTKTNSLTSFLLHKASKKRITNKASPDALFTTPYILVKLIERRKMDLSTVQFLVLDEADRLFSVERARGLDQDMTDSRHYVSQLDAIVSACSLKQLVKALFSATFPPHVSDLANNILTDPVCITVGKKNAATQSVEQHLLYTGSERGKLLAIRQIFSKGISPPVVVFVDTKERADELMSELLVEEIKISSLHSDVDGRSRSRILRQFHSGQIWILIATDLVSRGIDFIGVNMVINYDFPKSTMDYIHRIGRAGRAGKTGQSFTFFTDRDREYIRPIANTIRDAGGEIPQWMTSLKKGNWRYKKSYGSVGHPDDI